MSKVFFVILIVLFELIVFPSYVFASEDCSAVVSGSITYEPKAFPPPTAGSNLILNFTINNDNAYNNLKGQSVRLHYIVPLVPGVGDYNTPEVTIPTDKKTFPIPLTGDSKMISPGDHEAVLDLVISPNRHEEYCKGIKYRVGDPNACVIGFTPAAVPPNSVLPSIPFAGKPNTKYYLFVNNHSCDIQFPCDSVASIDTDSSGQGAFSNVEIKGTIGETKNIALNTSSILELPALASCGPRDIKLSNSAPMPSTPPPGPVITPPPGTTVGTKVCTKDDPTCTLAGGKDLAGCTGNKNNPGIATAIGCIHTNPTEFVKDFLTFIIGIGGGLAFLMMLLGVFQMLTSAGNPETLSAGRDRLQSAIIGLLFIIFAVLLLQIIGFDILKLPGFGR